VTASGFERDFSDGIGRDRYLRRWKNASVQYYWNDFFRASEKWMIPIFIFQEKQFIIQHYFTTAIDRVTDVPTAVSV